MAVRRKNISPTIIPKATKTAILNPDARALDTHARTPGPGMITIKNKAPENVSNS
jgi:hypothetical protein